VRRTLAARRLQPDAAADRGPSPPRRPDNLVGQSHQMAEVYTLIARVAGLDTTVLIQGETGTGKELVARAIHAASARADRPFVVIDCAALPEALFESELFGHERGAFSGALTARPGLFETSAGGTCFLDEIAELTPPLQARLLRALQERAIRRVGGNEPIPIDVRIVAATTRDLHALVSAGEFRDDLYYRLNVVTIAVPPLRERATDIPLLAQHFLEKFAEETGRPVKRLAPPTLALLASYQWPGNVRELEHAIERAVALASSETLLPEDLPSHVRQEPAPAPRLPATGMTLDDVKRWYIQKVLDEAGGNKVRAADLLGINRRTLYRILERQAPDDE
jgi:transcriptional regulator with PAS, ATPase and Fis domain